MKLTNVFNLIIEGPDAVGKSTLIDGLFKQYNFRYMCYHRGEMSNYVFAKKFKRQFFATQNGLPFIYIYLYCNEKVLKERILKRSIEEHWTKEETEHELSKVSDVVLFEQAYKDMLKDYTIFRIDTSDLSQTDTLNTASILLEKYQNFLVDDTNISSWNKMYKKICKKLSINFKVVDNQPYIDGKPVMVESTLHNGEYETYADKKCYDNTLYAMAYEKINQQEKVYDFNYIINSKIKRRPEIFEYYKAFEHNNLTCMVSGRNNLVKDSKYLIAQQDFTENDYLENISRSYATVYCSRDLAYLELQTARLYEAILAKNIVFVDEKTDRENKILKQIYPNDKSMQRLMRVNPNNIAETYKLVKERNLTDIILKAQDEFWKNNVAAAIKFYKGERK